MRSQDVAINVLTAAKDVDKGTGVPIAETLVKAFLLRGNADTMHTQLAVTLADQKYMEKELAVVQKDLAAVEGKIQEREVKVKSIMGDHQVQKLHRRGEEWKQLGSLAAEEAAAVAARTSQATAEELQRLLQKLSVFTDQLKDSETLKALREKTLEAAAQAQKAAGSAMDSAAEAKEQLEAKATDALAQASRSAA